MFFRKKRIVSVDVMNISAMHISTGQIGSYIKSLYQEEGFRHIGYRFENQDGLCRFIIYTLPTQKDVIQYFKDRCPAMVEEKCIQCADQPHGWSVWVNGFEEIK